MTAASTATPSSCTAAASGISSKKSLHWASSVVSNVVHIPCDLVLEEDSASSGSINNYYNATSMKENLWYTKQDFKLFKKQTKRIVSYIRSKQGHIPFNTTLDEDQYCSRGIEHLITWESSMIRDHRVEFSRQVVLMEQLFRNSSSPSSTSPEDDIARVYKNITDPLQLVAYQRGLEDSRDAQLIYLEATATKDLLLNGEDLDDTNIYNDNFEPLPLEVSSDTEGEESDDDSSLNNFFELDFESWNDGDFAVTPTMKKAQSLTNPQSSTEAMVEPLAADYVVVDDDDAATQISTSKSAKRCRSIADISNDIDMHLHPRHEGIESFTRLSKRARTTLSVA